MENCNGIRFRGTKRLIERGGNFNQCKGNLSLRRKIKRKWWRALYGMDWFHTLIDMPTYRIVAILMSTYMGIIILFSFVYYGISLLFGCNLQLDNFVEAFAFSLETMAAVGYGTFDIFFDDCSMPILVLAIQVCVKLIVDAVTIGVLYCKLSRPNARASTVLFSNRAIIRRIRGKLYLMFQLCELRKHQLVEAHVRLYAVRNEVDPSMLNSQNALAAEAKHSDTSSSKESHQQGEHTHDKLGKPLSTGERTASGARLNADGGTERSVDDSDTVALGFSRMKSFSRFKAYGSFLNLAAAATTAAVNTTSGGKASSSVRSRSFSMTKLSAEANEAAHYSEEGSAAQQESTNLLHDLQSAEEGRPLPVSSHKHSSSSRNQRPDSTVDQSYQRSYRQQQQQIGGVGVRALTSDIEVEAEDSAVIEDTENVALGEDEIFTQDQYMRLPEQDNGDPPELSIFGKCSFMQTCAMRLNHPNDELGGMLLLMTPQVVVHEIDAGSPLMPPPLWYCNYAIDGQQFVRWNPPVFRHFAQCPQPAPPDTTTTAVPSVGQQHPPAMTPRTSSLAASKPDIWANAGTAELRLNPPPAIPSVMTGSPVVKTSAIKKSSSLSRAHSHRFANHSRLNHRYNLPTGVSFINHNLNLDFKHSRKRREGVEQDIYAQQHNEQQRQDSQQLHKQQQQPPLQWNQQAQQHQQKPPQHQPQPQQPPQQSEHLGAAPFVLYDAEALARIEFPSVSRRTDDSSSPAPLPSGSFPTTQQITASPMTPASPMGRDAWRDSMRLNKDQAQVSVSDAVGAEDQERVAPPAVRLLERSRKNFSVDALSPSNKSTATRSPLYETGASASALTLKPPATSSVHPSAARGGDDGGNEDNSDVGNDEPAAGIAERNKLRRNSKSKAKVHFGSDRGSGALFSKLVHSQSDSMSHSNDSEGSEETAVQLDLPSLESWSLFSNSAESSGVDVEAGLRDSSDEKSNLDKGIGAKGEEMPPTGRPPQVLTRTYSTNLRGVGGAHGGNLPTAGLSNFADFMNDPVALAAAATPPHTPSTSSSQHKSLSFERLSTPGLAAADTAVVDEAQAIHSEQQESNSYRHNPSLVAKPSFNAPLLVRSFENKARIDSTVADGVEAEQQPKVQFSGGIGSHNAGARAIAEPNGQESANPDRSRDRYGGGRTDKLSTIYSSTLDLESDEEQDQCAQKHATQQSQPESLQNQPQCLSQNEFYEKHGEFDWQFEERRMVQRYMRDRQIELVVVVEGVDAATGGIVQARHSYTCDEIEWDKSFTFCVFKDPEDGCTTIDFSLFHQLCDVPKDASYAGPIASVL